MAGHIAHSSSLLSNLSISKILALKLLVIKIYYGTSMSSVVIVAVYKWRALLSIFLTVQMV